MSQLPVAVSREHVDAVRATAAMFTDADHSHGGGVTSAAGVYLGHPSELLRLPASATLRPDLFCAVGWLGHIVGSREAIWRGDADTGLTWIELAMVRADRLTATERAMLLTARARACLVRPGRARLPRQGSNRAAGCRSCRAPAALRAVEGHERHETGRPHPPHRRPC
jgi:hypothetical protein